MRDAGTYSGTSNCVGTHTHQETAGAARAAKHARTFGLGVAPLAGAPASQALGLWDQAVHQQ